LTWRLLALVSSYQSLAVRAIIFRVADYSRGGLYRFLTKIGEGAYAEVYKAIRRGTADLYAVKRVDKTKLSSSDLAALRTEADLMLKLNHPNIVRLYDTFESAHYFDLVLEFCVGGDLIQRLMDRRGAYSEPEAKSVVRSLCNAIAYCHRCGVVHRDLKPDNMLYLDTSADAQIKVGDFGYAQRVKGTGGLNDDCGTLLYAAPEILEGQRYDSSVDMWSIGVIAFLMLSGTPPFYAEQERDIFQKICEVRYSMNTPQWSHVSLEAKRFVKKLLQKDPNNRLTAAQALQHKWLGSTTEASSQLDSVIVQMSKNERLKRQAIMEGHLDLKGGLLGKYKQRAMLLHPEEGIIYLDSSSWAILGSIPFEELKTVVEYAKKGKQEYACSFTIQTNTQGKFTFRARTIKEKDAWKNAIKRARAFWKTMCQAKRALRAGNIARALQSCEQGRRIEGFRDCYLAIRLWARLAEHPDVSFAGCNGFHSSVSFQTIHSEPVGCLAVQDVVADMALDSKMVPDRYAVTGGEDKQLIVWDAETGGHIRTMKDMASKVKAIAMTQGSFVIAGAADGNLHAYNLATGQRVWRTHYGQAHTEPVSGIAMTPNGTCAVSVSWDMKLMVWDAPKTGVHGRPICNDKASLHKKAITSVALSDDGKVAVSGDVDGNVKVWNVEGKKCTKTFKHADSIRSIALGHRCNDGDAVITGDMAKLVVLVGCEGGRLSLWSLQSGSGIDDKPLADLSAKGSKAPINDVALDRHGCLAIASYEDRSMHIWDMQSLKQIASTVLASGDQEVSRLSWCGTGGICVVAHENQTKLFALDLLLEHNGRRFGTEGASKQQNSSKKS